MATPMAPIPRAEEALKRVEHAIANDTSLLSSIRSVEVLLDTSFVDFEFPSGYPFTFFTSGLCVRLIALKADPEALIAAIVYPLLLTSRITDKSISNQFGIWITELSREIIRFSNLEWDLAGTGCGGVSFDIRQAVLRQAYQFAIGDQSIADSGDALARTTRLSRQQSHCEKLVRMLLSSTNDVRAITIKLVERLHLTLLLVSQDPRVKLQVNQAVFADVNFQIYAAIAERLGLWKVKSELEDASFKLKDYAKFHEIARAIDQQKEAREAIITDTAEIVSAYLENLGFTVQISGRAKHIYGIYKKMLAKNLNVPKINDLFGIRIIVNTDEECYAVLGALYKKWAPLAEFYSGQAERDWIVRPKENQYQSLHTTLQIQGQAIEVQIRTFKMHEIAEYGVSTVPWIYKRDKAYRDRKQARIISEKDRLWHAEFVKVRRDVIDLTGINRSGESSPLKKWVFVLTPHGDIVDLPRGSTPLDFAYRIHTEIGHGYAGAKIGGRLAKLDYQLQTGDIVELIPHRGRAVPSQGWLATSRDEFGNAYYPYANVPKTRHKIRQGLRRAGLLESPDSGKK